MEVARSDKAVVLAEFPQDVEQAEVRQEEIGFSARGRRGAGLRGAGRAEGFRSRPTPRPRGGPCKPGGEDFADHRALETGVVGEVLQDSEGRTAVDGELDDLPGGEAGAQRAEVQTHEQARAAREGEDPGAGVGAVPPDAPEVHVVERGGCKTATPPERAPGRREQGSGEHGETQDAEGSVKTGSR